VKTTFKERRSQVTEGLTKKSNSVPLDVYDDCPVQLSEKYTKYVVVKGDYFKGK
jgi:hypothetical protein